MALKGKEGEQVLLTSVYGPIEEKTLDCPCLI